MLAGLSSTTSGVFRGAAAVAAGVSRRQLVDLCTEGAIERVLPDTYRLTAVPRSRRQRLDAALIWAGEASVAEGRSAGGVYGLEAVRAERPEVSVPRNVMRRHASVSVSRTDRRDALMIRRFDGVRVTGVEATIVRLAHLLTDEALEIACRNGVCLRATASNWSWRPSEGSRRIHVDFLTELRAALSS
ncbi:MAG TPA: type IV toxin-antitoxin system AbiEi family antitoxin domain-containing protein [Acidimicrobiia bacterium]